MGPGCWHSVVRQCHFLTWVNPRAARVSCGCCLLVCQCLCPLLGFFEGACWGADDGSPPDCLTVATSSTAQPSLGELRVSVSETKQQETTEQGEFEDRKLLIKVTSAPYRGW